MKSPDKLDKPPPKINYAAAAQAAFLKAAEMMKANPKLQVPY